ncbi:MAG: spermidine/putrescine ABC transporter permease PotC [Gammaproteobacteria bacterium]
MMTRFLRNGYATLVYAFLYFPIAVIVAYSFNNSKFSLVWHGFTLDWYRQLWQDSSLQLVALHSLLVGVLAATFASLLGTVAAISLFRYRFFGKQLLHGLIFVLIISPDIVMAISLLLLYTIIKLPLGFWSLLLSHITFCMPFVTVIVYSRVSILNKYIFEAAQDLGAGDFTTFRRIMIPLLWPAILAGWLLSFTLSIDDVIISYFVTGPDFQILPLTIFSLVRLGIKPEINALCTVILGITLLITIISQLALGKKQ